MAYIGKEPIIGNFQKCDAISVVNGQAAYTLQVSSTNVVPESANHMLVSLNGILQAPVTSFTVSGSTLTFASNKFTLPSGEGGKYFFFAAVEFAQDDRQVRLHAIYKNGSAVKHLSKHHGIADSQMQISGACFLDLSATDYVEHYVYQNAGDAINVIGGATATYFGGFKVS